MNTIIKSIRNKAVAALVAKDWPAIVASVKILWYDESMTGAQKKKEVFFMLRDIGISCMTWLLYAAIQAAYDYVKEEQQQ